MPPRRKLHCGFSGPSAALQLSARGPTMRVDIGFDPNYKGSGPANFPSNPVDALVDTGAETCFIDNMLAKTLQLPIVDRTTVAGSIGRHAVPVYLGHIHVPILDVIVNGRFGGIDLSGGADLHLALIGRSFLAHFQMAYDGTTGTVELMLP